MSCDASSVPCGMSRTMMVLVRSSKVTLPRSVSTPFTFSMSVSSAFA